MFGWLFGKKVQSIEQKAERGFSAVRKDMDAVGKWIKHLDSQDKQLFDVVKEMQYEISSMREEIESLREGIVLAEQTGVDERVLKKTAVESKQTAVEDVYEGVQTPVQTANFYNIFRGLTAHERALVFTLMNSELKLSYEDLALLMGKEKSTVRGQINAIKQKSEGLIKEISEKNGKKRVFVPEEVKEKLAKYAKVRVGGKDKKVRVNSSKGEEKDEKENEGE